MDTTICSLLKQDHDTVRNLLTSIEKDKNKKLFHEFRQELTAHTKAEEEAFYDPLKTKLEDLKIVIEGNYKEHDIVSDAIAQISKIRDDKQWWELFAIIKETLEAHLSKEESKLFALADQHFTAEESGETAKIMAKLKAKYLSELK